MSNPSTPLEALVTEAAALSATMDRVNAVQWSPSIRPPKARDDTTERSHGTPPSDPTGDTVADERRLALRAGMRQTDALLRRMTTALRTARVYLERALAAWQGETYDDGNNGGA
jgi:hypothetical protein